MMAMSGHGSASSASAAEGAEPPAADVTLEPGDLLPEPVWSSGKASTIGWAVQAAVGCSVTLKWRTRRR